MAPLLSKWQSKEENDSGKNVRYYSIMPHVTCGAILMEYISLFPIKQRLTIGFAETCILFQIYNDMLKRYEKLEAQIVKDYNKT